ncbi:hypothetical protein BDR05DRAFT_853906, partial [Suillus weaverae]
RMANGTLVPLRATWRGEVTITGVRTQGEFEVFDSGGGWKFLFGKPMLHTFKAIHKYEVDTVHITGNGVSTTIYNQNHAELTKAKEHKDKVKETTTTQVNVLDNKTE